MKVLMVLMGVLAMTVAAPSVDPKVATQRALPALEHEKIHDKYGQYALRYVTAEGTVVLERGRLVRLADGSNYFLTKEGEISYIGTDGKVYVTKYSAGLDGAHIDSGSLLKPVIA